MNLLANPIFNESKFIAELYEFMTPGFSSTRNTWFKCRYIEVYLRKTVRILGDKRVIAIDVANVEVPEKYRRKGIYSALLKIVEAAQFSEATYVENATDSQQHPIYYRRNFLLHPPSVTGNMLPCFWKVNMPNAQIRTRMKSVHRAYVKSKIPATKKSITVNMKQTAFDDLNARAKANGSRSVAAYLLHCAQLIATKGNNHET